MLTRAAGEAKGRAILALRVCDFAAATRGSYGGGPKKLLCGVERHSTTRASGRPLTTPS